MRLIDADALLKEMATFKDDRAITGVSVAVAIARCSTIDPVHAAGGCYCRECERALTEDCPMCYEYETVLYSNATDKAGFCSYGRRREKE